MKDGDLLFQRSSETLEDVGRANVYMDNRTAIYGGLLFVVVKSAIMILCSLSIACYAISAKELAGWGQEQ